MTFESKVIINFANACVGEPGDETNWGISLLFRKWLSSGKPCARALAQFVCAVPNDAKYLCNQIGYKHGPSPGTMSFPSASGTILGALAPIHLHIQ